ncbi:MAG: primosomal protein N' [Myxococcales bacterium]|nr:primosomal protein N' [Myxococcales bacterium]
MKQENLFQEMAENASASSKSEQHGESEKPIGPTGEIALDLPIYDTYHYVIPEALQERVKTGVRVLAPVGQRLITGYFLRYSAPPAEVEQRLREIDDVLDEEPLFDETTLGLFEFAADYLFYPIGEVIRGALPAGINVESKQSVYLSDTGLMARSGAALRGPRARLLSALLPGEVLPRQALLERVRGARAHHLRELIRDGFLLVQEAISQPRVKGRIQRQYKVVDGVSLARREVLLQRAPRQNELWEAIREYGPISLAQLRALIGDVDIRDALRQMLKKGLIDLIEVEVSSDPFFEPMPEPSKPFPPTEDQQKVLASVIPGIDERIFQPFLLHGVTGSGKTEVYLQLIERVMAQDRQAIVLVPEISLTPQFVGHFRRRLGDQLTVLHSGLNEQERYDQWWRIKRGEVPLVIGARSAIFAPFRDLGMVIVDEEQETSYKQEGRFPYHARSLALMRAKLCDATVILGSATPAMESYANAQLGRWGYLSMPKRILDRPMPSVEVIDLRKTPERIGGMISPALLEALAENLKQGDQSILFLNRRGYHTTVLCPNCGITFRCKNCSINLTHHRAQAVMLCHYCGYAERYPAKCPSCGHRHLENTGWGTEKVQELLHHALPDARIDRMDRDTTSRKGTLEDLVGRFAKREIDILIGTQMIAKGHDFPGVTLVGVLLADQGLNMPDFRSGERTFQLLVQVAGRAGRGQTPGRVLIQTFNPEHPSLYFALQQDYQGFYQCEAPFRREAGYPPYGFLVGVRFEGSSAQETEQVAYDVGQALRQRLKTGKYPRVELLGPAPAALERIKNRFRWQLLLKAPERRSLHMLTWSLVREVLATMPRTEVKILIDTDPVQML